MLNCLREDYGPHKLLLRHLDQLNSTSNHRHAVAVLLISLHRHLRKHGDTKDNLCFHDSELLSISAMREEIIEHRLDDAFKFDTSSSLVCRETIISDDHNAAIEPSLIQPNIILASYQASNENTLNVNRKFTL